ncbi:MAG: S1 RNA-binding domain-containing protein [Lachnospiraceae bacterium]|nr:S1 RNA-binding domain-containing protein [Lachnospiraceae bacterium]
MSEELTMQDFEQELNRSFKKIFPGDVVTGTVIGISDTEVTLDLNYFAEGIIPLAELSNDPRFSIKADVQIGETISAMVTHENREGALMLSKKKADDVLSWDKLKELQADGTVVTVKIAEAFPAGAITYLEGIRAFIPASKLAINFVDDPTTFIGQTVQAMVITVNQADQKLTLSVKDVLKEQEKQERNSRIARLVVGTVVTGTVEQIMPYGAFVSIGDDLSGLLHISQICAKRLKTPSEVLKVGDTVNVKIIDVKDGKVSLSMKAVDEDAEISEEVEEVAPEHYVFEDKSASNTMASLFANIKL